MFVSPSVCRLSSDCHVRAPYLARGNFRQCFVSIWYLGHPLTSTENFTEIVPGEPLHWGGVKLRGQPNIAILDIWNAVSPKRCKIEGKFVLNTNRKSYMSFRLVPKSVTLNVLKRRNGLYFVLFQRIRQLPGALTKHGLRHTLTFYNRNVAQSIQFLAIYHLR